MAIDFNTLDFFEVGQSATDSPIQVEIAGQEQTLQITRETPHHDGHERYSVWEYLLLQRDEPLIRGRLSLFECMSDVSATTQIERIRKGPPLPKNFGLTFWKRILGVIPNLANTLGRPVEHYVSAQPDGFSFERWMEIFGPTLEEFGYTSEPQSSIFKRVYSPTNSGRRYHQQPMHCEAK